MWSHGQHVKDGVKGIEVGVTHVEPGRKREGRGGRRRDRWGMRGSMGDGQGESRVTGVAAEVTGLTPPNPLCFKSFKSPEINFYM